jgi:asparagine synthase (glutamine-hydrolysing)
MLRALGHRSPDGAGVFSQPGAGTLGHGRLAVMDPRGGAQPIASEDGSTQLVANGEFYNFRKLRETLKARHEFRTASDSEAALHLYEELGPVTVRKLDGMFALAIASGEHLFLARDPIGVKPLYYAQSNHAGPALYFASEIKALVELGLEIREFPPGTCYDNARGFMPYYRVPAHAPRARSAETLRRMVRATVEESVVKRLMSDQPLGVFLSGGLDSSVIAAVASRHHQPLHTFAVGTEGSSDLEAARAVARHIGSTHHEYTLDPAEVERDLDRVLYHLESFDQDLVRSAIPCFYCARMASDHVKVVLTGEGADELFAGYAYHREIENPDALHGELLRSIGELHHINLQRVDRMTMAHGIEGRVPFLDLDLVHLASIIQPELKLRRTPRRAVLDKWILRASFEDLLPESIAWRDKEQFDEGSGTLGLLDAALRSRSADVSRERSESPSDVRSVEEAVYYQSITESYGAGTKSIVANMGRWSARPTAPSRSPAEGELFTWEEVPESRS